MGSLPYGLPPDGGASFFDDVDHLLVGDVVLGNLEGTLANGGTSKCGSGSSNCFAFRTPPSYARHLKEAGFTVMNLANNHAYDFGASAQRETVAALRRVGVRNTGRPGTMAVQRVGGQRVAVLGFASYDWADPLLDIPAARRRVQSAARKAEIVVVTFHGGAEGSDRTHVPSGPESFLGENRGDLRRFSKAVIDAGADIVVGHGPHVLRGMEVYRGRLIAYSLGNFGGYEVFGLNPTTATSMVLQATLAPDGRLLRARIRPTQLVGNGVPAPGGAAISMVRGLSQDDFGARAPRIGAGGVVTPSRGS
jgi:poly-gamma-glutamate capsule biosynthesis protein CapA/YwtB (metallophosphatase superfamily)